MNRRTIVGCAGVLFLASSPGCVKHETSSETFGRFTLVHRSWMEIGPCPKQQYRHELVAPDGDVVLEWARTIGATRDGHWSFWRGGQSTGLFAVDHRKDVLRALPSAENTSPDWFRPGTEQLVLQSISGGGDEIVLTDLGIPDFNRTLLCRTQGHMHALAWSADGAALAVAAQADGPPSKDRPQVETDRVQRVVWKDGKPTAALLWTTEAKVAGFSWSAGGRSLAFLEVRKEASPDRCRLLHVRSFDPPDVVPIEESDGPPDAAIVWQDEVPRLRRR